jgi:hypothetical protein
MALAAVMSAGGCSGRVEVGEAKDSIARCHGHDCPSESSEEAGAGGEAGIGSEAGAGGDVPDCSAADAATRAIYDEWRSTPNEFGELAGSTFAGYVEGGAGSVTLMITTTEEATLVIGEPVAAPVKDEGYLCGDLELTGSECSTLYESDLLEGASYPVYGAVFEDGRLTIEVEQSFAADPWCVLQDPVLSEPDCYYSLVGPAEIGWGAPGCSIGGEAVDCGWFEMAVDIEPCACTSTECFARVGARGRFSIDARLVTADEFEGSLVFNGAARTLHLSRIPQ